MKIYRSLADPNSLKAYVEREYGILFQEFTLFRDIGGAVYSAVTAGQKFMFKLSIAPYYENAKKSAKVLNYLQKQELPVAPVVPTGDGRLFIEVKMPEGTRIGTLCSFVEGSAATYEDIFEIGELTARMHRALADYPGKLPRTFTKHRFADKLPEILQTTSYPKDRIETLREWGQLLWSRIENAPMGAVHGDWDMGNILKGIGGKLSIIDCDNAALAPIAYDVASICSRIDYMVVEQEKIEETKRTIDLFCRGYASAGGIISFGTEEILNFIAAKRFEGHAHALEYVMPFQGNQHFQMFMDATYRWFQEWGRLIP